MIAAAAVAHQLGDALSQIASVLAVPVLIAAVIVLVLCASELGRWISEASTRRRTGVSVRTLTEQVLSEPDRAGLLARQAPSVYTADAFLEIASALLADDPDGIEYVLDDYEHRVERRLDRTRILVRAGPAIGLMGTLIPLAPGLRALGRGDVALLSDDLRIAFAATVMGLLAGTVAFALTLARTRRWTEDLNALERATAHTRAVAVAAAAARVERDGRELAERDASVAR
jgi:biopolymer transport protein ExbB/TolQ